MRHKEDIRKMKKRTLPTRRSTILSVVFAIISLSTVHAQFTHNVVVSPFADFEDKGRIHSMFRFFEQRIKAHDAQIGYLLFDTAVVYGQQEIVFDSLVNSIHASFSMASMDTTALSIYYLNRPPNFYPCYSIDSILFVSSPWTPDYGTPAFPQNLDTVFARLVFRINDDTNLMQSVVGIQRRDTTTDVPNYDYRIVRLYDDVFMEAISAYAFGYAANFYGENGFLRPQWLANDWYAQWDFLEDKERNCIERANGTSLKIDEHTLLPLQLNIYDHANNRNYSYWNINRDVAEDKLDRILIGQIGDFYALSNGTIGDRQLLLVLDSWWDRLLLANLYGPVLHGAPHNVNGQISGHVFGSLYAFSVNPSHGTITSLDARDVYAFDSIRREIVNHEVIYNSLLSLVNVIYDTLRWSPTSIQSILTSMKESNGQSWSDLIYWKSTLSEVTSKEVIGFRFPTGWIFPTHGIEKEIRGYVLDNCGTFEFKPYNYPLSFKTTDDRIGCDRGYFWPQRIAVCNNDRFIILTPEGSSLCSLASSDYDIKLKALTVTDVSTDANTDEYFIPGTIDFGHGHFLLSDRTRGLIHNFESYEGKYVCSYKPPYQDCFDKLIGARYVHRWMDQISGSYNDIVVAQDWKGYGFSRFIQGANIIAPKRVHAGDAGGLPDVIQFTLTGKSHLRITLLDPVDEIIVLDSVLSDERFYSYSVFNRMRLPIKVSVTPASESTFPSPHQSVYSEVIFHIDGSITKESKQRSEPLSAVLSAPYPNPFSNSATIELLVPEYAYVHVVLYDVLGRKVKDVLTPRFLPKGMHTLTLTRAGLPSGSYFVTAQVKEKIYRQSLLAY